MAINKRRKDQFGRVFNCESINSIHYDEMDSRVTIITKDDPCFKELAKAYTPPKKLKKKDNMATYRGLGG